MRRTAVSAMVAICTMCAAAMPLGIRLAIWNNLTPDMVAVELSGGERVSVPNGWLTRWPTILAASDGDCARAARSAAANGRTVAECYALGLDPTDAEDDFRITSIWIEDGEPKVEWEPKVNRWTGETLKVTVKGAAVLPSNIWDADLTGKKFFIATVELP